MKRNRPNSRRQSDSPNCAICLETYVRPRILPCGHSYCERCIRRLLEGVMINSRRNQNQSAEVNCPICRHQICDADNSLPIEEVVNKFPLNRIVIAMLEDETAADDITSCDIHAGRLLEFLCIEHNCVCCSKCVIDTHRDCKLVDLEEDDMKKFLEHVRVDLVNSKQSAADHLSDLDDRVNNITLEADAIKEQYNAFRKQVEKQLDEIGNAVSQATSEIHVSETKRLAEERRKYQDCIRNIDCVISGIDQGTTKSIPETVSVIQTAQEAIKSSAKIVAKSKTFAPMTLKWNTEGYEEEIQEIFAAFKGKNIVLIQTEPEDKESESAVDGTDENRNDTTEIGAQGCDPLDCCEDITLSLSLSNEQPLWFRKAEYINGISAQSNDSYANDVTAVEVLPNRNVLLIDHGNNALKEFSVNASGDYICIKKRSFRGRPWGLTTIHEKESRVAVSFPFVKFIVILDLVDGTVAPVRLQTERKCYGIRSHNDRILACTFDDEHSVVIFDMSGNVVSFVSLKDLDNPDILRPISLTVNKDTIYVSCNGEKKTNGALVVMDLNGNITKIYTNRDLVTCHSSAVDRDGNIYVCGYGSSNVHVIANSGNPRPKEILSQEDGLNNPSHIAFFPSGNTFLVGDSSSFVKIYKLK